MSNSTRSAQARSASSRSNGGALRSLIVGFVGIAAILALAAIFSSNASSAGDSGYAFQVGEPSTGPAPEFALPSASGQTVALDDYAGDDVLLYFQEGLMCQPCWDQLSDIEERWGDFEAFGIDAIVSITTDPVNALAQKVQLEDLSSPVLSDRDLAVSKIYDSNSYGMMGGSHNGHTFILVGPEGDIRWRTDYGGAPDYTMYLPVDSLLSDLRAGLSDAASES